MTEQYVAQSEIPPLLGWPATTFRDVIHACRPGPAAKRLNRRVWYELESACDYLRRISPEVFGEDAEIRIRRAASNPFQQQYID